MRMFTFARVARRLVSCRRRKQSLSREAKKFDEYVAGVLFRSCGSEPASSADSRSLFQTAAAIIIIIIITIITITITITTTIIITTITITSIIIINIIFIIIRKGEFCRFKSDGCPPSRKAWRCTVTRR